jgi:short chain dehydrogenase
MAEAVLITGANRGLGCEFAGQYSTDGWRVFAACRNPVAASNLRHLAQNVEGMLKIVAMDVTDAESVRNAATQLKDVAIDVLINSAGIAGMPGQKNRQCRLRILGPSVQCEHDGAPASARILLRSQSIETLQKVFRSCGFRADDAPDSRGALREPVSVKYRTGLSHAETEIEKWRADTDARNPPRKDRKAKNRRSETGARQPNPRESRILTHRERTFAWRNHNPLPYRSPLFGNRPVHPSSQLLLVAPTAAGP